MDGSSAVPAIEGLTPERSVLIVGPPMTGKYELLLALLARYVDDAIMISTRRDAATVREDLDDAAGIPADRIGVIDCAGRHGADGEPLVTSVNSPADLTGIGVAFTDLFGEFHGDPDVGHVGVGLHSVSQLLMHTSVERVYQFLQVLTGQVRSAGWFHVSVMDAVADDEEGRVVQHHFDGVIETRQSDDGDRELRSRGLTATASPWRAF